MDKRTQYPSNVLAMDNRVTRYAFDVVSGKLNRRVGKTEIQACERHLRDLSRQASEDFPFLRSPEKAHVMIDFAESLTLAEGEDPRPLELWGFRISFLARGMDGGPLPANDDSEQAMSRLLGKMGSHLVMRYRLCITVTLMVISIHKFTAQLPKSYK